MDGSCPQLAPICHIPLLLPRECARDFCSIRSRILYCYAKEKLANRSHIPQSTKSVGSFFISEPRHMRQLNNGFQRPRCTWCRSSRKAMLSLISLIVSAGWRPPGTRLDCRRILGVLSRAKCTPFSQAWVSKVCSGIQDRTASVSSAFQQTQAADGAVRRCGCATRRVASFQVSRSPERVI